MKNPNNMKPSLHELSIQEEKLIFNYRYLDFEHFLGRRYKLWIKNCFLWLLIKMRASTCSNTNTIFLWAILGRGRIKLQQLPLKWICICGTMDSNLEKRTRALLYNTICLTYWKRIDLYSVFRASKFSNLPLQYHKTRHKFTRRLVNIGKL